MLIIMMMEMFEYVNDHVDSGGDDEDGGYNDDDENDNDK